MPSGYCHNIIPSIGPDGTGVGHVFWYTLDAKKIDLGEQRALQDWYVKFALQTVPGVAEVASFGGFEKQYQLVIDPIKLQSYNLSLLDVIKQVKANNNDVGGRKFEMSDMAYIIRGLGYPTETVFLHKDEFEKQYKIQPALPAVFVAVNGAINKMITKQEIDSCKNLEQLKNLVHKN